jgi:hypothetical protein
MQAPKIVLRNERQNMRTVPEIMTDLLEGEANDRTRAARFVEFVRNRRNIADEDQLIQAHRNRNTWWRTGDNAELFDIRPYTYQFADAVRGEINQETFPTTKGAALKLAALFENKSGIEHLLSALATEVKATTSAEKTKNEKNPEQNEKTNSAARAVVDFVQEEYMLGNTSDEMLWAAPKNQKHARRATELRSIRPQITKQLFQFEGRIPGSTAVAAAFDTRAGFAADAPSEDAHLRVAPAGTNAVHIDLAGQSGTYVEASPHGWDVHDPATSTTPTPSRPFRSRRRRPTWPGHCSAPQQPHSRSCRRPAAAATIYGNSSDSPPMTSDGG